MAKRKKSFLDRISQNIQTGGELDLIIPNFRKNAKNGNGRNNKRNKRLTEVFEKQQKKTTPKKVKRSFPNGQKRISTSLEHELVAKVKEIASHGQLKIKDVMNRAVKDYVRSNWDDSMID